PGRCPGTRTAPISLSIRSRSPRRSTTCTPRTNRVGLTNFSSRRFRSSRATEGRTMDKRIVVFGAGAIGGYTGGNLAHIGFDVTLIDPWPEHIEAIRKDGLALDGVTESEFVRAHPKNLNITAAQNVAK